MKRYMKKHLKNGTKPYIEIKELKYSLIGILWIILSCTVQKKALTETKSVTLNEMEVVLVGNYGGGSSRALRPIRKYKALTAFYAQINRTKKVPIPVPEIDFSKEMLLLYTHGETIGTMIPRLKIAEETDTALIIKVNGNMEESNGTHITEPFCLYKIPMTKKAIRLQE